MSLEKRLSYVLLLLRLSIFLVMIVWTLDKFMNHTHASKVFETFYFSEPLKPMTTKVIGVIQLLFVTGFVLGYRKRITYAAVLLMHTVSTLSSFGQYMNPYEGVNLLFFAAWPMLAACIAVYVLRDYDTISVQ